MSDGHPPATERKRTWWVKPLSLTLLFVYGAQAVPFFVGPLTECDHCVGNYLKLFPIIPGMLAGHSLVDLIRDMVPGAKTFLSNSDTIRFYLPATLTLAAIVAVSTFATYLLRRRWWQWVWLIALGCLSGFNALFLSALLRA